MSELPRVKRDSSFGLKLSAAERRLLREAAALRGVSESQLARAAILHEARTVIAAELVGWPNA